MPLSISIPISILFSGLVVASLAAQSEGVPEQGLEGRFIANAGVELSDGATTFLIDFPKVRRATRPWHVLRLAGSKGSLRHRGRKWRPFHHVVRPREPKRAPPGTGAVAAES
jgi:hypothetical protein